MVTRLLAAGCLMALCVIIHAGGVTWALHRLRRHFQPSQKFWRETWLFIRVAIWMVLLHLLEISVWAAFYSWQGALPDLRSASYFSAVTYTTTGYGDLVLPEEVAARRRGRGTHRHLDVRMVHRILLCGRKPRLWFARQSERLLTIQLCPDQPAC